MSAIKMPSLGKLPNKPLESSRRRIITRSLWLLIIIIVFAAGFLFGNSFERSRQKLDLNRFWRVYDLAQERFVGSIDDKKAIEGATKGLVESFGDPFSSFLPASEKNSLDQELKGQFEGIGAELEEKDGLITVISPLEASPAEASGLKPNDIVVKIDGKSTENMSLNDAVAVIRGPKGTKVTLTVVRKSLDVPLEIIITRESILVKSVKFEMKGEVGYLNIRQFGDDTVELSKQAVREIMTKNPKAIIIDLRNNPGGYLDDVAPIAGLFIAPSVVVLERYKDGKTDEIKSTELPVAPNIPLFLLVNDGSASASEILAGALQDYGRATLIGKKTFGKGSVQDLIPLGDGSALRLTIAEWLTPKKRSINGKGIEPDIKVEAEKTVTADPVLEKALELANK